MEVATYLGKEDALFLPSGVMAQNIVLMQASKPQVARQKRRRFIVDHTSHLLIHEKDAYSLLLDLEPLVVPPKADDIVQYPMSFADVDALLDDVDNVSALIIELPHREIGGKCTPYTDLVKMSEKCRKNGITFHMDGARLWEASSHYTQPITEICNLFDSIFVSFYKGLGGIAGSMLLGNTKDVLQWNDWLRRFGGNTFSQLSTALSCWSGFISHKDSFPSRKAHLVQIVHEISKALKEAGNTSIRFDPPIPEVSMVHVYLNPTATMTIVDTVASHTGIKVCNNLRNGKYGASKEVYFELNIGPNNIAIPMESWIRGYMELAQKLQRYNR